LSAVSDQPEGGDELGLGLQHRDVMRAALGTWSPWAADTSSTESRQRRILRSRTPNIGAVAGVVSPWRHLVMVAINGTHNSAGLRPAPAAR
jgi:hypothetical protein